MNLIVKPINLVFQTHNANSKDLKAKKKKKASLIKL